PEGRRLHHRRVQLRRQAAPPVGRPDRPVLRPHRRDGHHRPGAAGRRRLDRERDAGPVQAGTVRRLVGRTRRGDHVGPGVPRLAVGAGPLLGPPAQAGHGPPGAPGEPRQQGHLDGGSGGVTTEPVRVELGEYTLEAPTSYGPRILDLSWQGRPSLFARLDDSVALDGPDGPYRFRGATGCGPPPRWRTSPTCPTTSPARSKWARVSSRCPRPPTAPACR